jgi:glutamate synthase domain-containing protein 2
MLWITLLVAVIVIVLWDLFQTEHSLLRTYPLVGHLRYIAEALGVYFRQFFYARDTEEEPFNRADRTWVYRAAKTADTTIGFGSTRNPRPIGTIYFVASPFPVLYREATETHPITIGPNCKYPYTTRSLINISAMSYGSISKNAILALSKGAKKANCWLNTGEGGISPYHLEGGCDLIAQIGTAKFGFCDENGNLSDSKLKEAAALDQVKMFEVKLSQGAKPGKGGILPASKVTPEIAKLRNVPLNKTVISPNRFLEIANSNDLLDFLYHIRQVTGKPTGFKCVLGDAKWLDDLCMEIRKKGLDYAPDFITLDGAEGGTGAAPMSLVDYMGYPIAESLPILVDKLVQYSLRERIKVIASGKLITPDMVVWALATGADLINSARGFMFALGCIQSLQCNKNTCPTGVATQNPWLEHGLDPTNKAERVYQYVKTLEHEVGIICHSCGVHEPRQLSRRHVRMVCENGTSVSLEEIYPDQVPLTQ